MKARENVVWQVITLTAILVLFFVLAPVVAASQELPDKKSAPANSPDPDAVNQAETKKEWAFSIATYGWLAGVKGDIYTEGINSEIDVPFSDIFEDTKGGFMIYTEARWRKWFFAFDGTWAKLSEEIDGIIIDTDITIKQKIFEIKVGREIYHKSLDGVHEKIDAAWQRDAFVDLFAGARYFSTEPFLHWIFHCSGYQPGF